MKHVIIGTAGHVDHGKTALVRALTGIDTDRLREEKNRGLTIELGFAPFVMPQGHLASIVDVPGHERFIKTMVAGIMGIDLVLLVIAADEGIMPQTREHLDIIDLLGVKQGVVALTKKDLVDDEWLDMVAEEVRDALVPTTLATAPLVCVSAKTGEGIGELMEAITKEATKAGLGVDSGVFRLPVDRVFVMEGHGTVVTGTVYGGTIRLGEQVAVLPEGHIARVRNIQVHGDKQNIASAGQRCALNLAGITSDMIKRGDTIAHPGTLGATERLDAVLSTIANAPVITHGQRVRLHLGTVEMMSRVRIIGPDDILPGTEGYVQLYLEEPVVAQRGDRYIIRSYSPATTIGGGQILLSNAPRRRRHGLGDYREMQVGALGSPKEILQIMLQRQRRILPRGSDHIAPLSPEQLARMTDLSLPLVKEALQELDGLNVSGKYLARDDYRAASEAIGKLLVEQQIQHPFRLGIHREELKSTLFPHWERKDFVTLLDLLAREHIIFMEDSWVGEPRHYQVLMGEDHPVISKLEEVMFNRGLEVQSGEEIAALLSLSVADTQDAMELLGNMNKVVQIAPGIVLHAHYFRKMLTMLEGHLVSGGSITVGEFRDMFQINRKLAIALLEYLDAQNYTRRQGQGRVAGPKLRTLFTKDERDAQ